MIQEAPGWQPPAMTGDDVANVIARALAPYVDKGPDGRPLSDNGGLLGMRMTIGGTRYAIDVADLGGAEATE